MYDLDSLQQALRTNVSNSVDSTIDDFFGRLFVWVVLPTILLTVLFLVFYIMHILHRRKVENAILDIRDTLRRMEQTQTQPTKEVHTTAEPANTTTNTSFI